MIDHSTPALGLRRRLRQSRDRLATLLISAGGIGVIAAVLAIGVFLALEVAPLFTSASVDAETSPLALNREQDEVAWMQVDGPAQITLLDSHGTVWQGSPSQTLAPVARLGQEQAIVSTAHTSRWLALGLSQGEVILVPRGDDARPRWSQASRYALFAGQPVDELVMQGNDDERWLLAGRSDTDDVAIIMKRGATDTARRHALAERASHLALGGDRLVLADDSQLSVWSLAASEPRSLGQLTAVSADRQITAMTYLVGGETLLVGDSGGGIRRWLNTHGEAAPLVAAEPYRGMDNAPVIGLLAFPERRLALAIGADGGLALYQALAGQRWRGKTPDGLPRAVDFTADGRALWWLGDMGLTRLAITAEHAEVSWETLWTPVLYEGHDEALHRWQVATGGVESETRFGLAPLAWGTLKAAAWALVFAIPLALGAAVHSAVYMSAHLRTRIKPTLELMEALPGVVIGFVAGLVLAPYVERHLAGALALAVILPLGMLLAGALWARLPHGLRARLPLGWAGIWLMPWLALLVWLAMYSAPSLEALVFGGDLRAWLETRLGLDYASRNAMIVGLAMGFAVVPTIYALAEDALAGVPRSLGEGAQALGATRWQALWRVLLPAASPGIFSAVMIGAGRAVGETMIVLMATGNTALMSWNPFEGLRSAAANLAIELPEAAVGSTHYRLLFLSALLLFVFTFCVNTLAEVVRLRLKRRYRHLGSGT
ncbi:ABC transporter permease subunit [Modicisalibacter xianhensis]|uniref:Phosphate transport system permease protein n=1 Tax=Modicisalibacter xianhensis TaxID=442341 RepID=A0A1I3FK32_9GAMM|nr:ABC transporter permease subunit [Halomonas xianhensis]SFI11507.1 phosphate transport system permease protein [Halomonas xianhensis]